MYFQNKIIFFVQIREDDFKSVFDTLSKCKGINIFFNFYQLADLSPIQDKRRNSPQKKQELLQYLKYDILVLNLKVQKH